MTRLQVPDHIKNNDSYSKYFAKLMEEAAESEASEEIQDGGGQEYCNRRSQHNSYCLNFYYEDPSRYSVKSDKQMPYRRISEMELIKGALNIASLQLSQWSSRLATLDAKMFLL
ncbi:hypothetical protein VNO77_04718 [Canavalia gladiata]|uniref:Uncharacterized protein n=1 Tax=Canavalia gladiata TaxID=3824 RepID=A0AAN9R804_CANGL